MNLTPKPRNDGIQLIGTLSGHDSFVTRFCWSPNGKYICSSSLDRTVRIWHVNSSTQVGESIPFPAAVWKVVWADAWIEKIIDPSFQSVIAVGYMGPEIQRFDATDPRRIRVLPSLSSPDYATPIYSLAWSIDGEYLAAAGFDRYIHIWGYSKDTGWTVHKTLPRQEESIHKAGVNSLAWSPSDHHRYLVSGSADGTVRLWDVHDEREIHCRLDFGQGSVNSVTWFPPNSTKSDHFVSAHDNGLILAHSRTQGETVRTISGHESAVKRIDISRDGRLMASKSADGTVRLWDTETWKELAVIDEPGAEDPDDWHAGLTFHPIKPRLASLGNRDKSIRIWNLDYDKLQAGVANRAMPPPTPAPTALRYVSAKIVMVGDSGVGKTGLGWRLAHGDFTPHESSHGQQFWALDQLRNDLPDGTQCEAVLWDLAGQPDYRLVHALFLDDTDLVLLIFDPTRENDPLRGIEYWLRQLGYVDANRHEPGATAPSHVPPPIILVAARADRGHARLTDEEITAFCKRRGIQAYVSTSARTDMGIASLEQQMRASIHWDEKRRTVTTAAFDHMRELILDLKENPVAGTIIVSPETLRGHFLSLDPTGTYSERDIIAIADHLDRHGYLAKLHDSKDNLWILTAPERLNNLAASFILAARQQPKGLGSLQEDRLLLGYDFQELNGLSTREQEILIDAVVERFLRHHLCFRESDPLTGAVYLIFPELINQKRPAIDEPHRLIDGAFYTVSGAVENVYATLVVLLGYTNTFTRTNQWRGQARYEVGAERFVCGFRQDEEREGELDFTLYCAENSPDRIPRLFQALIESFLGRINLTVWRFEPVRCPKGHLVDWGTVKRRMAEGFAFCGDCGTRARWRKPEAPIQLSLQQSNAVAKQRLMADLRSRFEHAVYRWKSHVTEGQRATPSCFISYAWGNVEHERWVEYNLASDLQKAGVEVVLDQWKQKIGDSVPRFVERAATCDFIIVVGTPAYPVKFANRARQRGNILAAEGDLIGKRMIGSEEEKATVLPLLLDGDEEVVLPELLQGRVFADFRDADRYFQTMFELIPRLFRDLEPNPFLEELRQTLLVPKG